MNTRKTSDYSPTIPNTPLYFEAVNARRQMLKVLASIARKQPARRKTWAERMTLRTGKQFA